MTTKLLKLRVLLFLLCITAGVAHTQTTGGPSITALTAAAKNKPDEPAGWFKLGQAYFKLDKYDLAVANFTKSLNIDADNLKVVRSRGTAYYKLGKFDSAIIDLTEVIDDSAFDKGALQMRGDAYRAQKKYHLAASDYTDFLYVDTAKDAIWYNRGIAYYKLGRYDSAIHDFTKAASLQRTNTEYAARLILAQAANNYYNLAGVLYNSYQQKKLVSYINKPEYAFLKYYLDVCTKYLSVNNYQEALPLLINCKNTYKPAADGNEKADSAEYAVILAKIGTAYEKLDTLASAVEYYSAAKGINPASEDIKTRLVIASDALRVITTPALITLEAPANTSRGQYISPIIKKKTIYVKAIAKAPSGIAQVKINGADVTNIDSTGVFESNISDTSSVIHIQAWTKKNVLTDTVFRLAKAMADIPVIGNNENYYGIFIANTDYHSPWPPLESTITEAEELRKLLVEEYSFQPENIDTIFNKSRRDILKQLRARLSSMTENDNILIFYGGHGKKDDKTGTAFWVPAGAIDEADYISNMDIDDALAKTEAKHVLIMADACYASLMRSENVYFDTPNEELVVRYSRQLMASGNAEQVPGKSVFVPEIISHLKTNPHGYIAASKLLHDIYNNVLDVSHKEPIIEKMSVVRSDGGQFYFKRKSILGADSAAEAKKLIDRQIKLKQLDARDSLIKAGIKYQKEFDVANAVRAFDEAVKVNPEPSYTYAKYLFDDASKLGNMPQGERFRSFMDTAMGYENRKDHQNAMNTYVMLLGKYPDKKDSLNSLINGLTEKMGFIKSIQNHIKFGTYKEALKEFKAVEKKYREDPEFYFWRATCYKAMGDHNYDVTENYTLALSKQASYKEAIKALADFYRDNGKKKDAIDKYTSYVSLDKDPLVFMELYKLYNEQANFTDDAIEALSSAITQNSSYAEAYFYRGLIYHDKKQDFQKALDNFNLAIHYDSTVATYYFYRGNCYLHFNKLQEASIDYKIARSNKLDSTYIQSIQYYADNENTISMKFGADKVYDSAIHYVNRAILIDAYSPIYRFEKGNYYYGLNKYTDAIANYDSAVYFDKNYKDAYFNRGLSYYNLGKYTTAIDDFNRVLKLKPLEVMAVKSSGDAWFALKNYDSSASVYKRALDILDDNKNIELPANVKSAINNNLGYAYYALKSNEQSIAALKRAIKFDENNAVAFYNISQSYQASGDLKNAAESIDRAIGFTDYSNNPVWNYGGGDIYRNKNENARAIDYYTKAIANDTLKQLKPAWYFRGYCYSAIKEFENAARDYLTAVNYKIDTSSSIVFYNQLGKIYLHLSTKDSAYFYYKTSFEKDSTEQNATALYGMASALFLQGKEAESLPVFDRAFKLKYPKSEVKDDEFYDKFRLNKDWKKLFGNYKG